MTHQSLPPFSCWAGPRHPRLLLVGEAWGREEAESGLRQPFIGEAGKELWRMLGEAIPDAADAHARALDMHKFGLAWVRHRQPWLEAVGIAMTNVLNFRPPNNSIEAIAVGKKELPPDYPSLPAISKGKYLLPEYLPEIDRLQAEIAESQPNLILAFGNTACWALLQSTSIGSLRGAITSGHGAYAQNKILPSYHPAAVLRQWSWRPIVVTDLIKAWREAQFPEIRRPSRQILVNPTIDEIKTWTARFLLDQGIPDPWKPTQIDFISNYALLSCDIETKAGQITCIGFARSSEDAMVVPFLDESRPGWCYWADRGDELVAWRCVRDLLYCPAPKLFQNGVYDLQYLYRYGLRPRNVIHDTMLLHHTLHPEMQKGLGFLGSIYTNEPAWKLMRRKRPDTEKRDE